MGNGIFKEYSAPTREGLAGLLNDRTNKGKLLAFEPIGTEGDTILLSRVHSIFTAQAKVLADTRNGNSYIINPFHEEKSGVIISRLKHPSRHLEYNTRTGKLRGIPYASGELHPLVIYEGNELRADLSDVTAIYEAIFRWVPRPLSMLFGSQYQTCTDPSDLLFSEIIRSTSMKRRAASLLPASYRARLAAYSAD